MSNLTVAIDPGNTASAFVAYDPGSYFFEHEYDTNENILGKLEKMSSPKEFVMEMIVAYGPVGKTVIDTAVWIGRFWERILQTHPGVPVRFISRATVKSHVCHSAKANDAAVNRALIDRFGGGNPSVAKGTKKNPGPLYGVSNDERAALALAIAATEVDPQHDYDFLLSERIIEVTRKRNAGKA